MTYFSTKPASPLYVGEDYWYYGSPNDYDLYEGEEQEEKVGFVWENPEKRNELIGWLNGACNNL